MFIRFLFIHIYLYVMFVLLMFKGIYNLSRSHLFWRINYKLFLIIWETIGDSLSDRPCSKINYWVLSSRYYRFLKNIKYAV